MNKKYFSEKQGRRLLCAVCGVEPDVNLQIEVGEKDLVCSEACMDAYHEEES